MLLGSQGHRLITRSIGVSKPTKTVKTIKSERKTFKSITVTATKYNAVEAQCDGDPLVTADMSKIDLKKLKHNRIRWVAVSRDLLKRFNYGDTIKIECSNEKLNGYWVIHDTMHTRFKNRIDFLVTLNDEFNFFEPIEVHITKHKPLNYDS